MAGEAGAGPARYLVASGKNQWKDPPGRRPTDHPYSWTSLWWKLHTRIRLSRSVRPPRCHHTPWWAWVNRRVPQEGSVHSPWSRWRSWRSIHSVGSRDIRPTPTARPEESSATTWTLAKHSRRRTVSG